MESLGFGGLVLSAYSLKVPVTCLGYRKFSAGSTFW